MRPDAVGRSCENWISKARSRPIDPLPITVIWMRRNPETAMANGDGSTAYKEQPSKRMVFNVFSLAQSAKRW